MKAECGGVWHTNGVVEHKELGGNIFAFLELRDIRLRIQMRPHELPWQLVNYNDLSSKNINLLGGINV